MNPAPRPVLRVADFSYSLPAERIASEPLADRESSRLLVYHGPTDVIEHRVFSEVSDLLPANSLLVVNRSRVVAARLRVRKPTGGAAEILLTRPVAPTADPARALMMRESSDWECLVGGRNILPGMVLESDPIAMQITVLSRNATEGIVRISWDSESTLSSLLDQVGHVPLPPYIKREDTAADRDRYQTVFAREEGSVAAPTAGLHFTEDTLARLHSRGVQRAELTLHVGLGTFQPVEAEMAADHAMHAERIEVDRVHLQTIVDHCKTSDAFVTVVGTTSMRTLQSLSCSGCRIAAGEDPATIDVDQWSAYDLSPLPRHEALEHVLQWMDGRGLSNAWG